MQRIVIRHINGSKANQVEEFPLQHFRELVLGREVNCAVKFDPNFDDLVSRQHARIVRDSANPEAFSITDLESRNGTMVNRQRVSGATRLQHGDVVQLGPGGPEFRFEVDPTPAQAMRETRLAQTETMRPAPPTREAVGMSTPPGMTGGPISDSQQKRPVGRATVERMLGDVTIKMQGESNKALTVGVVSLAAILVLGGGLWFYQRNQAAEAARSRDAFLAKQAEITQRMDDLGHNQDQVRQLEEDASALRAQLTKKYGTPAAGAKSPEAEELKKTVDAIADQKAQLEKAKAELDKKRAALAAESAKLPDQVKALVEEATKTSAVPVLPEYAGSFAPPVASGGPKTPEQIPAENLDSVVAVETAWKLLDTGTGRELYQNYAVVKRVCDGPARSEEHTSELQSHHELVC